MASRSFPRVALYFENSVLPIDLPLLPAATSAVTRVERIGPGLAVESRQGVGVPWKGPARVDGRPWPARDGDLLWLPPGAHLIEPGGGEPAARLIDFNGELKSAAVAGGNLELAYASFSRALAVLDRQPLSLEVDSVPAALELAPGASAHVLLLPRGQHLVTIRLP
ncbi:MAG: hypothetical protein ABSD56_12270, partial [Bryobacteraceae bacterium]